MGRIGDLLELIYTAYDNFTSMSATFTYRYIPSILHEEINELAAQNPGSVAPLKRIGAVRNNQERAFREYVWRVWIQKPSSWRREDHEVGKEADIHIINGDQWWFYNPGSGTLYTNVRPTHWRSEVNKKPHSPTLTRLESALNNAQFADPSFFLSSLILNPVGSTFHAGREAILVKAVPRKNRAPVWDSLFWSAADEIDLLVDKERGVLLRYSAKRNRDEYAVASAESIAFDEPIPESSFYFVPEPNMQIHVVDAQ